MIKRSGLGAIAGGLGIVPAAKDGVDADAKPPTLRTLKPSEAQALMWAELIQAVQGVTAAATELTSRIGRAGAINGVLAVQLAALDVNGLWQKDFEVTAGSALLVNHGANPMTVHSGPAGASAPLQGVGVQRVAAGQLLRMPIGDRTISVWGTPADAFSVQVFTGLQAFGVGGL